MIRLATEFDISQIYDLGKKLVSNFFDVNNLKRDILDESKVIVVCSKGNKVIGFSYFTKIATELELLYIFVDDNYRNLGYATKMLDYVFDCYNLNCYLEVNVINCAAIDFYKKYGFNVIYTRKNYYDNKYDAFVMERESK